MRKFILILFILVACQEKKEKKEESEIYSEIKEKIEILPRNPSKKDALMVRTNIKDYTIKWFINGKPVSEEKILTPDLFKKNDTIFAEVNLKNEKIITKKVFVRNTPPLIEEVSFNKQSIFSSDKEVKINIRAKDIDGDNISFFVKWYLNGELVFINGEELKENLRAGDILEAFVYATDGEDTTKTPYIIKTMVLNSPPQILEEKGSRIEFKEGVVNHKIKAIDPDGDPLKFKLISAPPDIFLDSLTGVLYGKIKKEIKKNIVKFEVRDTAGNKITYEFNLIWKE